TAGNLFFGFWAIIQLFEGNILVACWMIIAASIMDGLDGKVARLTHCSSKFGTYFDSLADTVSFGLAPAVLLYAVSFNRFGFAGVLLSLIYLLFGVLRLVRFTANSSSEEKSRFEGLPIPMAANTLASFVLFNHAAWHSLALELLLIPISLGLAFLMISRIPYEVLPRFTFRDTRKNLAKLVFIIGGIILVAIDPQRMFFPLMVIYLLKGILTEILSPADTEEELEEAVGD
ncbi:CDP-diacylglycerol--serine O-phosphatidyltransferase, partial [bacterium]|nr:CDP-diacylglycerol--serine O-phosphatidyltransferase [bacterium]